MSDRRFGKDFFTWIGLPVAREYIYPPGRQRLFVWGAGIALVAAGLFVADAFAGRGGSVTTGTLTDSHALFGADCSTCHTPFEGAEDRKCSSCHERAAVTMARYGWERHYLYRSQDYDRSAPTSLETGCAACHVEHQGRTASLQAVEDRRCVTCHDVDGFENHPEFVFAVEDRPDPSNLLFPHAIHVREVMEERDLHLIEDACLDCHVPTEDGGGFEPISFEQQCDACHLNNTTATPPLPVVGSSGPGVQTLATIRESSGPGSTWAHYSDPNEFRTLGPRVTKRPVYHADPWVMENLRRIRREMYPGSTLADLLRTSAELPSTTDDPRALHDEAVATLRDQIEALGGEPSEDVQEELDRLTMMLDRLERRLADPYEPLDETRFLVGLADRAADLDPADLEAYQSVVDDLTAECTGCHLVNDATIARVQTDQRTMVRAEFDHGAHVLHARCLDCHTEIPVSDWIFSEEEGRTYSDDEPPPEVDRAEIQNLPTVATCQSCHDDMGPAADCSSCHLFHPDRSARSELSRTARRRP